MSQEKIISTNAFEAVRTENGIVIKEINFAYRKTGLIIFVLGLVCAAFSYVVVEIPIKKIIVTILSYGLFYGGILALVGGIVYLLISFNVFKPKTIEFDTTNRMLRNGRRKVPFDSISGFSCEINKLVGISIAKIKIKEGGVPTLLISPPIHVNENAAAIRSFVDELNELIRR